MEITWSLKSQAIWILEDNKDTKLFHFYANHSRKVNIIWEISDADGNCFWSQQEITNLAVTRFEQTYKCRKLDCGEEKSLGGK